MGFILREEGKIEESGIEFLMVIICVGVVGNYYEE